MRSDEEPSNGVLHPCWVGADHVGMVSADGEKDVTKEEKALDLLCVNRARVFFFGSRLRLTPRQTEERRGLYFLLDCLSGYSVML